MHAIRSRASGRGVYGTPLQLAPGETLVRIEPNALQAHIAPGAPCVAPHVGRQFRWDPDAHLSADAHAEQRALADPLFDEALAADGIDDLSDAIGATLASAGAAHPALGAALDSLAVAPDWADWDQIALGQRVFVRFLPPATMTLFYLSLLGGFSAERIARVVASTGCLNGDRRAVLRRIVETGAFLAQTAQPGALRPGEAGWAAALRVRLLHARVRRRLRTRCGWEGRAWDEPINVQQLCATQLAFSASVLQGIEWLGGRVRGAEREAFVHLWRYLGWLLGVPDRHNACVSAARARGRLDSYLGALVEQGPIGRAIARALLALREPSGAPSLGAGRRAVVARALLGDVLADELRVPRPRGWWERLGGAAELALMRAYTRLCGAPLVGRLLYAFHDRLLRLLAARTASFAFALRRPPERAHIDRAARCPASSADRDC